MWPRNFVWRDLIIAISGEVRQEDVESFITLPSMIL